jgi:hypothetical protein
MGEDATRCRHPNLLANLALLRSTCLLLHARDGTSPQWLPAKKNAPPPIQMPSKLSSSSVYPGLCNRIREWWCLSVNFSEDGVHPGAFLAGQGEFEETFSCVLVDPSSYCKAIGA